jgi:hypothetical protein
MTSSLDNVQCFDLLINPLPPEFQDAGVVFSQKKELIHPIGKSVLFCFKNVASGIEMTVSIGINGVGTISVCKDEKHFFSLDEYLTHHKRDPEKAMFFNLSYNIEDSLNYLRKIIATDWLEILQGKRWEDIPRDWMGYK